MHAASISTLRIRHVPARCLHSYSTLGPLRSRCRVLMRRSYLRLSTDRQKAPKGVSKDQPDADADVAATHDFLSTVTPLAESTSTPFACVTDVPEDAQLWGNRYDAPSPASSVTPAHAFRFASKLQAELLRAESRFDEQVLRASIAALARGKCFNMEDPWYMQPSFAYDVWEVWLPFSRKAFARVVLEVIARNKISIAAETVSHDSPQSTVQQIKTAEVCMEQSSSGAVEQEQLEVFNTRSDSPTDEGNLSVIDLKWSAAKSMFTLVVKPAARAVVAEILYSRGAESGWDSCGEDLILLQVQVDVIVSDALVSSVTALVAAAAGDACLRREEEEWWEQDMG